MNSLANNRPVLRKAKARPRIPIVQSTSEPVKTNSESNESVNPVPVDTQEKFWTLESGKVAIDENNLYNFLNKKGFRYFVPVGVDSKYIVQVYSNNVVVFFCKLCELCCSLIDKEFTGISEDEKKKVKDALKGSEEMLKKRNLVQLTNEELESYENTGSMRFLKNQSKKFKSTEGGLYENK
jgi:hypothetical protein